MHKILLVDDEAAIRQSLREILEYENYKIDEARDGLECTVKLKKISYDVVLLDVKMPKMNGFDALDRIRTIAPNTSVIMISGHSGIPEAIKAVKNGAFDFIQKPLDMNKLQITIKNAINRSNLVQKTEKLERVIRHSGKIQEIIGESGAIKRIKEEIEIVAPNPRTRVLITGPNGSGKELVARWLHEKSPRKENDIIEVNCAAIPAELIESELFGHEKGAFTSAHKKRIGKFEQAHNGTIFLDEIGDMSLSAQAKVLRVLQENRITRVGGEKDIQVDVRVLAATNKDLKEEIKKGNFREDLYHRLSVILLHVPPLNDRRGDIPELTKHFLDIFHHNQGLPKKTITDKAINELQKHDWSGNIRQLRNSVERLIIMTRGNEIGLEDVFTQVTKR